jgi:hypothetical protein
MGYYSEPESLALRDRNAFQRRRCTSAIRARPAFVLGAALSAINPNSQAMIRKLREAKYVAALAMTTLPSDRPLLLRRSASIVDQILRGTKPGLIPIGEPPKFDLSINLTSAQALNLTIPNSLKERAACMIDYSAARLHGRSRPERSSPAGCGGRSGSPSHNDCLHAVALDPFEHCREAGACVDRIGTAHGRRRRTCPPARSRHVGQRLL